MKTTEAIGYIDKIICDQERYEEWALEEKSEDEELLHEIECELEALKMAKRALEEKPRWIPCSERLPEMHKGEVDGEFYKVSDRLLFSSAAGVCCGFYEDSDAGGPMWYEDYVGGPMWYSTEGLTCENVTAWMPMPETYKED